MSQSTVQGLAIALPSTPDSHLIREPRDSLVLIDGKGIEGDAKFGTSDYRHVNIMTTTTYAWFERSFCRERVAPGGFGEQVLLSAMPELDWVTPDAKLRIGEVVLELATPRAPCKILAETTEVERYSFFVGRVGHMCRVLTGGTIKVGDEATLL